ncbi:lipopolysaccharide assembly protein LapB [Methylococcus sp. EFPC2]|uniref:tetratricopeptide repeat protein n=1 Tax=Methylococcus sp. EFPC2 TaxID=2812648 RepID=UPI001967ADBF|nr:hypothetical protein [Methylococcus sp. EFPC2]QSA97932.1 hypothetical protein JWZ97_03635 [Methylococcus sp. EFPC2]
MKRWIAILGLWLSTAAYPQAYRPAADDEVLEKLPLPRPERRELRELRAALGERPQRRDLALALARRYIEVGRADSDPRFYGHAEAVLTPWLAGTDPEALLLRATVLQNRHAFQAALADLDAALRLNSRLPQAWLSRAAILEVQGDYPGALRACLTLGRLTASPAAAVCRESALSLSGKARAAYKRLVPIVSEAPADTEEAVWTRGVLAELAERLGKPAEAESWYRSALALAQRNVYLLSAYADFLLEQDRPDDVIDLLQDETRADPLLLRLCLAEMRAGHPRRSEHALALKARYAAARARGDSTHQGDEARYALHIEGDALASLLLAAANWQVQREPRDARILLEAARAAGRPDAASPVREFLSRTRLEDVRLQAWLAAPAKAEP